MRLKKDRCFRKKILHSPISWALLAALLVGIPQLRYSHFDSDDYLEIGVLEGVVSYPTLGPLSLYRFWDGNPEHVSAFTHKGPLPWFTDPNLKVQFFRPLSSALLSLDHLVFGLNSLGYSIHNLLWYLALNIFLGLIVLRVFPASEGKMSHPAAYVASIMFAVSASHCTTVGLIAARWIIATITLSLAGLWAHLKWREEGWRPGWYLSIIACSLALMSGEVALAVLAFLGAYELFGAQGPYKERITAIMPFATLVIAYLLVYKAMGFGVGTSEVWVDPFTDPVAFVLAFPGRMLAMVSELLLGKRVALLGYAAPRSTVIGIGAGALALMGALLYPAWSRASAAQRHKINWMIFGTAGSILPLAAKRAGSHYIMIPFIGGSALVAFVLHYWWLRLRKRPKSLAWLGALPCIGLVYIQMILAPYSWFTYSRNWQGRFEKMETFFHEAALSELRPHQTAVFLNAKRTELLFYGYYYRKFNRLPMPEAWWQLSASKSRHRYYRTAENKLELEVIHGSLMDSGWALELRGRDAPLKTGEIIRLPGLEATIMAVGENGPTRVEFEFDGSLDEERYCLIVWNGGRLKTIRPPPVGQFIIEAL